MSLYEMPPTEGEAENGNTHEMHVDIVNILLQLKFRSFLAILVYIL